jgi:hypothetical protein
MELKYEFETPHTIPTCLFKNTHVHMIFIFFATTEGGTRQNSIGKLEWSHAFFSVSNLTLSLGNNQETQWFQNNNTNNNSFTVVILKKKMYFKKTIWTKT